MKMLTGGGGGENFVGVPRGLWSEIGLSRTSSTPKILYILKFFLAFSY